MPMIAQIAGGVRIEQHYGERDPPHFHAIQGDDEVSLEIATLEVLQGSLPGIALRDVKDWAENHKTQLALNWVLGSAQMKIRKI